MSNTENTIPPDIHLLIADYLSGDIDRNGWKRLSEWVHSSAANQRIFDQYNDIWQASASGKDFNDTDVNKMWTDVQARIQKKNSTKRHLHKNRSYTLVRNILGAAAAVILIFLAGMQFQKKPPTVPGIAQLPEYFVEMTAPLGSRAYVLLADSSKVWLNAGSNIRYSTSFGNNHRELYLEGEAYFSVARREDLPFVVNAADIRITALGTSFNVKAYSEEGKVETSLETGSVKIEQTGTPQAYILKPSQKVSLAMYSEQVNTGDVPTKSSAAVPDKATHAEAIEKLEDIRTATSWKDEKWIIKRESMESLAVKLSRRYNVEFVFRNEALKHHVFTTTLLDETLEQVLNMVQVSAPIKYTISEKTVYLDVNTRYQPIFEKNMK